MPSNTAFTGSIPEKYDRYLGPLFFEPYAQDIVSRVDGTSIDSVLEIACGTGRVTRRLLNVLAPSARLVATDLNADMLTIARSKINDSRIAWNIADAQDLHFDTGIFDLVICQFGIMFMPDKVRAFAEAYRVLKPGGLLLFNTWNKLETNALTAIANTTVNRFFPDNPPVFYHVPFSFYDEQVMHSLLKEAGFHDIKISLLTAEGISPSAKDAATGIVEGNPVYGFICERDASLVNVIRDEVEKELIRQFGDHPYKCSLQAWVCEARR